MSHDNFCCPIRRLIDLIGRKWTVEILRELSYQPTRTGQFMAHIPKLTMKVLRERLMELEADGLLVREKFDTKQPKVVYSLTDRGRKLAALIGQLKHLADDWYGKQCACVLEFADGNCAGETDCPARRVKSRPGTSCKSSQVE